MDNNALRRVVLRCGAVRVWMGSVECLVVGSCWKRSDVGSKQEARKRSDRFDYFDGFDLPPRYVCYLCKAPMYARHLV